MNIILFDSKTGHSRTLRLNNGLLAGLMLLVVTACFATGGAAGYFWNGQAGQGGELASYFRQDIANNAQKVGEARRHAEEQLTAMTVRMAELQARLMRLDALGERLVDIAKLDGGEFDFSQLPALGGPEDGELGVAYERPSFLADLDRLAADIDQREHQLDVLESLLANRKLQKESTLAGRPVTKGWMSSRFGRRTDPFSGRLAWHEGVDFAGKDGSDIVSVGSGVVTWAGERYGYGLLVEINHGGGYTTRYAHAKTVSVKVGDIVKKGQPLATMGSSGRSTGPHVHFEVRLNGKAVDPSRYISRNQG
jgi:murein DD-endopeptidase MepM/ murein hydrolase activator NlpD